MNTYKIENKTKKLFLEAGCWHESSTGKCWKSLKVARSALSTSQYNYNGGDDLEVIEYELVEKKRYKVTVNITLDKSTYELQEISNVKDIEQLSENLENI